MPCSQKIGVCSYAKRGDQLQRWEQRKAFGGIPSEILPEKYLKLCFFFKKSGSLCEEPMAEPALENELVVSS